MQQDRHHFNTSLLVAETSATPPRRQPYGAEAVSASAQTQIDAIAAILLEVIDLSDPIEVGGNETYLIT